MQTMVTSTSACVLEGRVNVKLSEGWVVVPGTATSGPSGFTIVLEKPEDQRPVNRINLEGAISSRFSGAVSSEYQIGTACRVPRRLMEKGLES